MAPTKWEWTKAYSKKGFDKAWHTLDYLGNPVNRLSNKLGSEAFWPTTLDRESDKAARILRSFCKDGFYDQISAKKDGADDKVEENKDDNDGDGGGKKKNNDVPRGKQRVLKKIPSEVVQNAKGLAIFTTMRTGFWMSGSGGSGVLLAKMKDTGEWSPPSGIMLHTAGLGFLIGVDIYDCVVVINTYEALEAFKKLRCTLGGEVSAVAGPVGVGGVLETEVHKRQAPIWTYLKSRGFYAGVQVDGTIIIERSDENERFYGQRIPVGDILEGKVPSPPSSLKTLMATIKAAQGDTDVDENMLPPSGEAPGDQEIKPHSKFGIPAEDDPDPYGVKALEKEGLVIREAGSQNRPSMDTFEFRPNPTSPIYDSVSSRRTSWRTSMQSTMSVNRATQTNDGEFDMAFCKTPTSPSSYSVKDSSPTRELDVISQKPDSEAVNKKEEADSAGKPDDLELGDEDGLDSIEIADVYVSNGRASATASFTKPRVVTIPPRPLPPALPPRNPGRNHSNRSSDAGHSISHSDMSRKSVDTSSTKSEKYQNGVVKEQSSIGQIQREDQGNGSESLSKGATFTDRGRFNVQHDTSRILSRNDSDATPSNATNINTSVVVSGLDAEEFHSLPNSPIE